jgi:hypothetical protein
MKKPGGRARGGKCRLVFHSSRGRCDSVVIEYHLVLCFACGHGPYAAAHDDDSDDDGAVPEAVGRSGEDDPEETDPQADDERHCSLPLYFRD